MSDRLLQGPAGSKILVEENHDLPLVRLHLSIRAGAGDDDAERDGLANFATELMGRGAAGRTRAALDAAFDALGTSLDIMTDYDTVTFEVSVLSEKLPSALALLADVVLRPDFPTAEADKLKREIAAQLDDMRDEDGQLARRYFTRALYGTLPYGRTVLGTTTTLGRLDAALAKAWHGRALVGGNVLFGVAGDVSAADVQAQLAQSFAALPSGALQSGERPPTPRRQGLRLTLVDKPERTQSQILLGQPAPSWRAPEFLALQVATTAFGGTFTARLMEEVRSKRGLSYGASARLSQGRGPKALIAHVFPSLEQTPETLQLVLKLWRDWVTDGISDGETAFARGYLAKSFAFSVATPEDRLELAAALELADMPRDYGETFAARVQEVTRAQTQAAQAAHLTPADLEVVIVSTAEELLPKLQAAGLLEDVSVEVVPYDSY
jgi:zinc protease